jgi:hypothetical protein
LLRKGSYVTEGTVLATGSPANSTTIFRTNVNTAVNNFYNGQTLLFVSGALAGQSMNVSTYTYITTSDSSFTTLDGLTGTPATGDEFVDIYTERLRECDSSKIRQERTVTEEA